MFNFVPFLAPHGALAPSSSFLPLTEHRAPLWFGLVQSRGVRCWCCGQERAVLNCLSIEGAPTRFLTHNLSLAEAGMGFASAECTDNFCVLKCFSAAGDFLFLLFGG